MYVVTGGTGALGLLVAEWLVRRGAEHVALIARSADQFAADARVAVLREGATIQLVPTDVCSRTEMARALDGIRLAGPPVKGIIHAAGILDDGALLDMPSSAMRSVVDPKVLGAWNLHELTLNDPLDWFVLFSSAAGVLGSPGQANYAAGNAFLDALAHYRSEIGLTATSIDWGPWDNLGLAGNFGTAGDRRLRAATSLIGAEQGLAVLERVLAARPVQTMVLPFDLRDLLQFYPAGRGMMFFDQIATEQEITLKSIGIRSAPRPDLASGYRAPRNPVEQCIVGVWQKALGIEPVGIFDSFFELGGDSVLGNQILIEIDRALGVTLDPQRAFEKLTPANLAVLAEEKAIARLNAMTETEAERLVAQQRAAF